MQRQAGGELHDFDMSNTIERKTYDDIPRTDMIGSWANGANGVVLFHSYDDVVKIGVKSSLILINLIICILKVNPSLIG